MITRTRTGGQRTHRLQIKSTAVREQVAPVLLSDNTRNLGQRDPVPMTDIYIQVFILYQKGTFPVIVMKYRLKTVLNLLQLQNRNSIMHHTGYNIPDPSTPQHIYRNLAYTLLNNWTYSGILCTYIFCNIIFNRCCIKFKIS